MFCCSTGVRLETHWPNVAYACVNAVAPILPFSALHEALAFFVASVPGDAVAAATAATATTNTVARAIRFMGSHPSPCVDVAYPDRCPIRMKPPVRQR